jgi:geranylgeranyl diphosphate synthase type II
LKATRAKTVPLIKLPLLTGALAANADALVHKTIGGFAEAVGLAYQIIDDLDDLVDSESGKSPDPEFFHPFHAWHYHRGRQNDSRALRVHKASRHAKASLQRARRHLNHLEGQVAVDITPTLGPLLVRLERRAQAHRQSAKLDGG